VLRAVVRVRSRSVRAPQRRLRGEGEGLPPTGHVRSISNCLNVQ
jgi:hypothetical protein